MATKSKKILDWGRYIGGWEDEREKTLIESKENNKNKTTQNTNRKMK